MKLLRTIISLLILILSLILPNQLSAQDNALQQDIRMAETILAEMMSDNESEFPLRGGNARDVQGEYMEGYGLHFTIGSNINPRRITFDRTRDRSRGEESAESRSPEEARDRMESIMRNFLQDYTVVARHLDENENVRVSYGLPGEFSVQRILRHHRDGSTDKMEIPKLSAVVSVGDVMSYRGGNMSDEEFQQRIRIEDLSDVEYGEDLSIFSSILKSSLDRAELEHLRVQREPEFQYIPGMGVHYKVNLHNRPFLRFPEIRRVARMIDQQDLDDVDVNIDLGEVEFDGEKMRFETPQIDFKMDTIRINLGNVSDSLNINFEEMRRQLEETRQHLEKSRDQLQQHFRFDIADRDTIDYSEDKEKVMNRVTKTLEDYGQTLRSLGENEFLTITINWRGRDLPERTVIRISREDLFFGRDAVIKDHERRSR